MKLFGVSFPSSTTGRLATLALGAALLAAGCAGYGLFAYRGLSLGLLNHTLHASVGESRNLAFCIFYWLDYMQYLELDEATGLYGFPADAGTGDLRCTLAYHRGDFAFAAACLQDEIERRGESEERLFWLALSLMRQAETENCLTHLKAPEGDGAHAEASRRARFCSLPLLEVHERAGLAQSAEELFIRLLDGYGSGNRLYRWLLSFNAMTAGHFPAGVPERYRLDTPFIDFFYGETARRRAERYEHLRFVDRAAELGVDTFDTGRGVAVEDFDGDGWLDLVTGGSFDSLRFYRNLGGRRFEDRTVDVGLGGVKGPFIITTADYDGDGWMDLFVAHPFNVYRLFQNRGDGTFRDVTDASGLAAAVAPGQIAATWVSAWGDVDNDGDLDLFLAQWNFRMPFLSGLMARPRMDSKLFLNRGDGTFADGSEAFGLATLLKDQYYVGATFGDYDGDGWADLFLSSPLRRTSVLLHNEAGSRFVPSPAFSRGESGFVAAFVDVDHDGRLDLFQSGFSDATSSVEMSVFGEHLDRYRTGHSTVMLQTPEGRFEPHDEFFDMPMSTMGASFGDLNNDGCIDFYLGTGNPESWFVLPNLMYLGQLDGHRCTGRTENISMLAGFGTIQKGHGIVFFDFDEDGDQDVYSSLGGMWPGDAWPNQMFVNESRLDNAWTKIRLRGRRTNRSGLGAQIEVVARAADGSRVLRHYLMGQGTGWSNAPYIAHIGLLDARSIERVEVVWPVSRCRASYRAELRQLNVLDEADCFEPGSRLDGPHESTPSRNTT